MRNTLITLVLSVVLISSSAFAKQSDPERLITLLSSIESLQGDFTQRLYAKNGDALGDESKGQFTLKKPGFFHWNTLEPYAQTVIGKPDTVLLYDPDLEQVTIRKQDINADNNPARLLTGNFAQMAKLFTITRESKGVITHFILAPKQTEQSAFTQISFKFAKKKLKGLSFLDQLGQKTTLEFTKLKKNKDIDKALFDFVIPEGTEVINE